MLRSVSSALGPLVALLSLALFVFTMTSHSQVDAQTGEGTVELVPSLSTVALEDGPFTVFVATDGLDHRGLVEYDDDRDTVPDRSVDSLGLAAFEFSIAYDTSLLQVVDVTPGLTGLERTGRNFQCLSARHEIGLVSFGCVSIGAEPEGAQGSVTLASVVLRPVGSGTSPLQLEAEIAGPLGTDATDLEVRGGIARIRSKQSNAPGVGPGPSDGVDGETGGGATTEPGSGAAAGEGEPGDGANGDGSGTPADGRDGAQANAGAGTPIGTGNGPEPALNGADGGSGEGGGFSPLWWLAIGGGVGAVVLGGGAALLLARRP